MDSLQTILEQCASNKEQLTKFENICSKLNHTVNEILLIEENNHDKTT